MASEIVLTGRVESGKLQLRNKKQMESALARWKDGEIVVTIGRLHATRNIEQNALYHVGYVKPLSEHTGYTPNEMHSYLKARFLPAEKRRTKTLLLHDKNGVVIDEYTIDLSTTTTLNKIDFSEYLHAIDVFASSLGVIVGSNREAA